MLEIHFKLSKKIFNFSTQTIEVSKSLQNDVFKKIKMGIHQIVFKYKKGADKGIRYPITYLF